MGAHPIPRLRRSVPGNKEDIDPPSGRAKPGKPAFTNSRQGIGVRRAIETTVAVRPESVSRNRNRPATRLPVRPASSPA